MSEAHEVRAPWWSDAPALGACGRRAVGLTQSPCASALPSGACLMPCKPSTFFINRRATLPSLSIRAPAASWHADGRAPQLDGVELRSSSWPCFVNAYR
eukprot:361603-Chlamydomonas_euryale.AAC.19